VGGKDSETQAKSISEFERRKELDGGAVAERCCYAMKKSLQSAREKRWAIVHKNKIVGGLSDMLAFRVLASSISKLSSCTFHQ